MSRASATAGLVLAVLLGGLVLPLGSLVAAADAPGASCCSRGHCCCQGDAAPPEGPCLRRGCGCDHPEPPAVSAPLQVVAVLRVLDWPGPAGPRALGAAPPPPTPLARPQRPLVPPPRPLLPA